MSAQPLLRTQRLALVPAVPRDLAYLHALWRQASVRRFLFDDQAPTLATSASLLNDCMQRGQEGLGLWLVRQARTGHVLGCVGLNPVAAAAALEPRLSGLLEPVAALEPAHRGLGFATEAVSALLGHGFAGLGVAVIGAANDEPNVASAQLLRRLGFQPLSLVGSPVHRLQTYWLERTQWRAAEAT